MVENAHFANEVHNYGINKRQAMYRFLIRHLELKPDKDMVSSDGGIDEKFVTFLSYDKLTF